MEALGFAADIAADPEAQASAIPWPGHKAKIWGFESSHPGKFKFPCKDLCQGGQWAHLSAVLIPKLSC